MNKTFQYAICLWLFLTTFLTVQAQNNTVSGVITDESTGETLIGASITVQELTGKGTISNEYGFFSLTLPAKTYNLNIRYVGYADVVRTVDLSKSNQRLDVVLSNNATLSEIEIKAEKPGENIEQPIMGVDKLSMNEVKRLPTLMGERDVIRSLQLLPGVKSGGEGGGGLFVRGGNNDQNLILLDEAPVYNASHLLGFFSTFNADAIKDATLYKGGMPAQYGGRLSSVLDLKMNEGNNQDFEVSGGIGLISSKLNIEGPIQEGKSSFLLTGRRTYADLFLKASSDTSINGSRLYFYDVNAKLNYQINDKNRIYLSGYFGQDVLGFGDQFGLNWGNKTGTLRWNHLFSDRLFSNTSLIFSDYAYNINIKSGANDIGILSRIRDWNLKQDFQYFLSSNHTLRFGANVIHHQVVPGKVEASESSSFSDQEFDNRTGLESAAYLSHEWKVNDRLTILSGLRTSMFNVLGGGTFKTYDSDGEELSVRETESGEIVKTYLNLEPRFSLSYQLSQRQSVKFSYNRNVQNLHLLSNSNTSNPTDSWVLTTENIKPEVADQVSVGWFRNFGENQGYEFSAETYYKYLQNQIDYRNGAEITANQDVEGELLYGDGRAYGLELLLRKNTGRLTGWVGYTLSRTERRIDGINNGAYYPNRYDRTHDLSFVAMYQLTKRWNLSASWIWNTGNAATFPSGKYEVDGVTTYLYTDRNGYRMPDNHRLDLGATFQARKTKRFESEWAFSLYNAYNRRNAYSITFRDSETNPGTTEAVRTALFGIIPSVSYNFKF
jgi:CarboxypepD_reg-like domain/TonB-dependent Receptor Plug Domain